MKYVFCARYVANQSKFACSYSPSAYGLFLYVSNLALHETSHGSGGPSISAKETEIPLLG